METELEGFIDAFRAAQQQVDRYVEEVDEQEKVLAALRDAERDALQALKDARNKMIKFMITGER